MQRDYRKGKRSLTKPASRKEQNVQKIRPEWQATQGKISENVWVLLTKILNLILELETLIYFLS